MDIAIAYRFDIFLRDPVDHGSFLTTTVAGSYGYGWRNGGGTGRDLPLRAPLIPFPGRDPGDPIYNIMGPFYFFLTVFSNCNSCIGGFGPFEILGDPFPRGPPRPSPPPPPHLSNHFSSPAYGSWISQIVLLWDPLYLGAYIQFHSRLLWNPMDLGSGQAALSLGPVDLGSCFFLSRHMSAGLDWSRARLEQSWARVGLGWVVACLGGELLEKSSAGLELGWAGA